MPLRTLALRFLAWLSLAVWVGGFMFYSAAVVPILHEDMDSLQAGFITQRVTDVLNGVGAGALAIGWALAALDRPRTPSRAGRVRLGALGVTTALLAALVMLHGVMDGRLEGGSLRGFYPLHRAYLILSTVQWAANLALTAALIVLWHDGGAIDRPRSGPT